jgi:hypothetical protein
MLGWSPVFGFVSILEDVLLGRVAMKVQVEEELFLLLFDQSLAQFLGIVNSWMQRLPRLQPLPVEIASS